MKMKTKTIMTIIAALLVKTTVFAQSASSERPNLEKGSYYALSPQLAARLNIDYDTLVRALRLRSDQGIVVKQNEEHEGVDISIFDSHQFAQARMDFVKF